MPAPAPLAFALLAALAVAAPARADEVPPEAVVAAIPFAPSGGSQHVRIDLASPGKPPLVMVVDTGASTSAMTPGAARAARVSVRRNKSDPYRRPTRLGRDVTFYVLTGKSDNPGSTGFEIALLGGDFLSQYVVEVDFAGATVRFLDPRRYAVPESVSRAGETVVPLQIVSSRPVVDVEIEGRRTRALLDTGGITTLLLSGRAARAAGIDPDALTEAGEVVTLLGPVAVRAHEAASLRIGSLELGPLRTFVSPTGLYNQAGDADSVAGLALFAESVLRIDYPRKRLWLRRLDR
jgi:predicted aspartyl protease